MRAGTTHPNPALACSLDAPLFAVLCADNCGPKGEHLASKTYYSDAASIFSLVFEVLMCSAPCYGTGHCCCVGWGNPKAVTPQLSSGD